MIFTWNNFEQFIFCFVVFSLQIWQKERSWYNNDFSKISYYFYQNVFFFYLFLDSRILERYFDTLSTIETADGIKAGEIIGTPAGLQ